MEKAKPGRPKNCIKSGGRKAGTRNKATIERENLVQGSIKNIFYTLTLRQMETITCLEVWQMCLTAALRDGNTAMALAVAKEYAPYKHAKLAPRIIDSPEDYVVRILGGLPDSSSTTVV